MKIRFLNIGKTKRDYIGRGIHEYLTRLRHYAAIEWEEIPGANKSKGSMCTEGLRQEAERIRAKLHPKGVIVVLSDNGKELSSKDFAGWIERCMIEGRQEIAFIIGGDKGLDPSIVSYADLCLSLSRMTFTHQMARLILLEQIYRAFTIIRGEPYHH